MSDTYTGKSPRNARIKIDYTGESPSVKFVYPRKDGYVGSMFTEFLFVWIFLLFFFTIIWSSGFTFGYDQGMDVEVDERPLLIPEEEPLIEYVEYEWYIFDWESTLLERALSTFKALLGIVILSLVVGFPPWIANKFLSKKLFPKYMAWRAKKKYARFTEKDIKVELINGKKLIYVEIPYFGNVILNYKATKNFSKYLDIMEIQEHNFKTFEAKKTKIKKKKGKKFRRVKKQNEWYWGARFYFSKKPSTGELKVIFK